MSDYPELPGIRLQTGDEQPMLSGDDPATRAVNGLFADLRDRRTLKWMFDAHEVTGPEHIPHYVQQEIAESWRAIIAEALKG